MADQKATLTIGEETYDFAMRDASVGPSVIDISTLYKNTDCFTFDPGFTSTASCESALTFIDGDAGILLHRGYPIDQLAEEGDFLETCYLLLYGELPTAAEKRDFVGRVTYHTMLHDQMTKLFSGFRRDAHPMAIMVGVVGALSAFYHDSTDITDEEQREIAAMRMIAKMPTIAAMAYKYSVGQPFVYPRNDLDYASNFLHMCFCRPGGGLRDKSGSRTRDGSHLHPSCRPRTERIDIDRSPGRLLRCKPLCLHCRWHCLPVGACPRRRERSGAQYAERDWNGRPHSRIRRARERQE